LFYFERYVMKKLILVLAIALMACPAMALNVFLEQVDMDTLAVKYSGNGTTDATRMRAVALTITAPAGVTLTLDAGSYQQGESTAATSKYGIYPARINIDSSTGVVNSYGSPLADATDPGAGTGDGTNSVVLEFGSLYFADTNAPGAAGTLCTFTVGGVSGSATIAALDEDTYRGGLVLENGDQGVVSSSILFTVAQAPGQATNPSPATGAINVNRSSTTLSWTAGTNAVTRDVYFGTVNPPVTKVIADGTATTYAPGTMTGKKTYYWRVDEKNSAGTTTGIVWSFTTICRGDYNASGDVTTADISALVTYWNANKNTFGKAPITGSGYVVGMDLTGDNFVTTADISALVTYWNANKNSFGKAPCMP
jgi:hypothetical protein